LTVAARKVKIFLNRDSSTTSNANAVHAYRIEANVVPFDDDAFVVRMARKITGI
jgi:hypothetical protein